MRRIAGFARTFASFCIVAAAVLLTTSSQLSALEKDQAIESCRNSSGKPAYAACKQSGGTHEACFARARSIVQGCVRSAMTAARPKAALFSAERLTARPKASAADIAKDGTAPLVAPPRTVSDISAILDQQKPDPDEVAKQTAAADAPVPAGLKVADLADFYYKRAQTRALLGRSDALADAELAVSNATSDDYNNRGSRYEQLFMRLLRQAGDNKRANALLAKQVATFSKTSKGKLFGAYYALALGYLRDGDIATAEAYVARSRTLLAEAQRWPVFPIYGMAWQAVVEDGHARVEESRGRLTEAEAGYHKASILHANSVKTYAQWESKPPAGQAVTAADWAIALEGRVKVKQGRVGEGEADVRRALLSRLSKSGKFHVDTAGILGILVYVVQEQGRYQEAEQLQREVIAIYQGLGYGVESAPVGGRPSVPCANYQSGGPVRRGLQALRPGRPLDRQLGAVATRDRPRWVGPCRRHALGGQQRQCARHGAARVGARASALGRQEFQHRDGAWILCGRLGAQEQGQRSAGGVQAISANPVVDLRWR